MPIACRVSATAIIWRIALPITFVRYRYLSSSLGILHITAPAGAGGLESVVRLLARSQQIAGYRVTVATVIGQAAECDHPFVAALAEDGVETAIMRVGSRSYLREWRGLRALFSSRQPDIVHTHGYRSDVIGGLASMGAHVPRVTTVHGFTGGDIKNRLNEWAQVRSYHKFNAVVAVSGAIAQRLRKAGIRERVIHSIPNAIDQRRPIESRSEARRRLGLADYEFVIGWVGRMSGEKGLDVLVEALRQTKRPFKAIFVGDGPDRNALEAQAKSLDLDSSIQWLGLVPDAASIFAAFDTFVLSSRTEGIPIVLLEAMRAVVPIVATRVGGVPEMLGDHEALLVPAERPAALAAAIDSIRDNRDAARRRAHDARARLDRDFAIEPWVERYDAVYRSVLAASPRKQ